MQPPHNQTDTETYHLAFPNGPFRTLKRTVSGRETDRFGTPNGTYWNGVKIIHKRETFLLRLPHDFGVSILLQLSRDRSWKMQVPSKPAKQSLSSRNTRSITPLRNKRSQMVSANVPAENCLSLPSEPTHIHFYHAPHPQARAMLVKQEKTRAQVGLARVFSCLPEYMSYFLFPIPL